MRNILCYSTYLSSFLLLIIGAFTIKANAQVGNFQTCQNYFEECGEGILAYYHQENSDKLCRQWLGSCSDNDLIYRFGAVNIGGQPIKSLLDPAIPSCIPSGYLLSVNDGIATDNVFVELCSNGGWCDYVFEKNYNLLSLPEVESFIKVSGHLPSVPSEDKIKEDNGIELREIKLIQQEKIEEIFLYLIEMEKQISKFEKILLEQKTENSKLRAELTTL